MNLLDRVFARESMKNVAQMPDNMASIYIINDILYIKDLAYPSEKNHPEG
jgi:hypothetical protein